MKERKTFRSKTIRDKSQQRTITAKIWAVRVSGVSVASRAPVPLLDAFCVTAAPSKS